MDITYAGRYGSWIEASRPLLEARRRREAFSGYLYVVNATAPLVRLRRSLSRCTVVPVTSGGLYLASAQKPFDEPNAEGDYSYRELPASVAQEDVSVSHGHYDPASALADLNCVFPVDRLAELAEAGLIAGVAPAGYSFMGYATDARRLLDNVARPIASEVASSDADAALLVPV